MYTLLNIKAGKNWCVCYSSLASGIFLGLLNYSGDLSPHDGSTSVVVRRALPVNNFSLLTSSWKLEGQLLIFFVWSISRIKEIVKLILGHCHPRGLTRGSQIWKKPNCQISFSYILPYIWKRGLPDRFIYGL